MPTLIFYFIISLPLTLNAQSQRDTIINSPNPLVIEVELKKETLTATVEGKTKSIPVTTISTKYGKNILYMGRKVGEVNNGKIHVTYIKPLLGDGI